MKNVALDSPNDGSLPLHGRAWFRRNLKRVGRVSRIALGIAMLGALAADAAAAPRALKPKPPNETAKQDPEATIAKVPIPDPVEEGMQHQIVDLLRTRRAIVVRQPGSAKAWMDLGIACDAHKLYDCAEACYRQVIVLAPNEFSPKYFLAFALDAVGKGVDESIELYRAAAKIEPKYPPLYYRLGKALERRDKLPEALDAYLDALNVSYEFAPAHRAVGQVRLALGDGKAALKNLEYAVKLQPRNHASMSALRTAYKALGREVRYASSIPVENPLLGLEIPDPVREVVKDTAIDSVTLLALAKAKIHAGEHADAIADLKIVEEVLPDDPYVHLYLGTCYHRTGELLLAAAHLKNAVRLKEDSAGAQLEFASLLIEIGRLEEGLHHYDEAVAYSPEPRDIHIWIGAALYHKGEYRYAAEAYESAARIASIDSQAFSRWASSLYNLKDFEGAAEKFLKATLLNPGFIDAYYNRGISLEHLGRIDEAKGLYRKVLTLEPDHPTAGKRLERLAEKNP